MVNDPINFSDAEELYVGIDDAIFAIGGALYGLLGQGISDLIAGEMSGWEDYLGSTFGGAIYGESLLYTGPVGAGTLGGASTNAITQLLKMLSGKKDCFDFSSLLTDAGLGGLTGLIPGMKIKGITSGTGSWDSIRKRMMTGIKNDTISNKQFHLP